MKSVIADISDAVRLYKCSGSIWQYRDNIPFEVKRYIAYKYEITLEQINEIAKDYVEISAIDFKKKWEQ